MSTPPFTAVTDAHVHLLPPRLLGAIRRAIADETGWTFPGATRPDAVDRRLREAGVSRYFALPYAHEAGVAEALNEWVLERAAALEAAVPFATVHGDDDVESVVRTAFEAGAAGLKFQCPVQESGPADPRLDPAFELAAAYDRPVVFHAGSAPMFEASPHVGVDQFERFLASYPEVRACCAHMGAGDTDAFLALAREHDSVFLDTTMALSPNSPTYMGVDPEAVDDATLEALSASVMYGTDFPILPYAYAEERTGLLDRSLSTEAYADIFGRTASRFLGEA